MNKQTVFIQLSDIIMLLMIIFLATIPQGTAAEETAVYNANPSNYLTLLNQLNPGDTLNLAAGTYSDGLQIYDMNGTAAQPIIIKGPDTNPRAIFEADSCFCYNTIEIQDSSYIEIYNLELDGNQLNGVDAVKAGGDQDTNWAHHITLDNLYIHDHDNGQQTVGISTKIPAWNWIIRNNIIDSAGTGMYLGNSDGGAPFVNGLIEGNLIVDTIGYNMQIKHHDSRTSVLGMPTADGKTIIRHNVFSKANNAAAGGNARPNVLVGHWPAAGNGSNDVYEIYGNFFYQNTSAEPLFQGEGNIALYDNLFFDNGANGEAVWIQPHNGVPQAVNLFNNTVVASDFGILVTGVDTNETQRVVGNAVFAPTPLSLSASVISTNNVTDSFNNAALYLINPTGEPGNSVNQLDLYPLTNTLTGSLLNTTPFQTFSDWSLDFNRQAHDGSFRGAYTGEGANPGWALDLVRKPLQMFTISGTITENSNGLAGVSLVSDASCSVTDTNGDYSCTVVAGWSGSIVPVRPGYVFTPVSRSYTAVSTNYTSDDYTTVFAFTNHVNLPFLAKP
jgi:hypothetical protein